MKNNKRKIKTVKSRDRLATINKLKETAIKIIKNDGIKALKASKIQEQTGLSRKLIYDYFGDMDGLLRSALEDNDSWISYERDIDKIGSEAIRDLYEADHCRVLFSTLLKRHLEIFSKDRIAQEEALLELQQKGDVVLKNISDSRERFGEKLFPVAEEHFVGTDIDIRCVYALLIAGINYMVLHRQSNGSTFCGIDIEKNSDFQKLSKTLQQIVEWAYDKGKDR